MDADHHNGFDGFEGSEDEVHALGRTGDHSLRTGGDRNLVP